MLLSKWCFLSFHIITFIFYIEISILIVNKFSKQSTRLTRMLQSPTMQQMESKCFLDFQLISTIQRLKLFISFTTICDKRYLIRLKSKRFSCGISTHLMQLTVLCEYHSKYPLLSINRDTCVYCVRKHRKTETGVYTRSCLRANNRNIRQQKNATGSGLEVKYSLSNLLRDSGATKWNANHCSFLNIFKPVIENNLTSNFWVGRTCSLVTRICSYAA